MDEIFGGLSPLPADAAVTMAYVPFQTCRSMFDEEEALCRGTLFTSLDKPFLKAAVQ